MAQLKQIGDDQAALFTQDDYLAGKAKERFDDCGIEHTTLFSLVVNKNKPQFTAQRLASGDKEASLISEFTKETVRSRS